MYLSDFDHTLVTSLCPCRKDSTMHLLTATIRLSASVIKESHQCLFKGPSPNTSAAVWGPRHHPKGTTVEKINLAAALLGPAAESQKGRAIERGEEEEEETEKGGRGGSLFESRAGIPILANCFVGQLPKL